VSVGGRQIYAAAFDTMNAGGGAPGNQQGARLDHASGSIAFEYRGLSFRNPARMTYQVRLEGFDTDWAPPTRSRTKEYTNLPPGEYVFRVRASNAEGIASEADAAYRFTITAPFWLKTWFYLALAALLLVAVLCFYRWRTLTFERLNRELESLVAARTSALESRTRELEEANLKIVESDRAKSRFLASTSHELRTPLNSILGFSELLTEQAGALTADRARKFAGNVQLSARHLLALINDILDLSKIEAGKMEVHVERHSLRPLVDSVLETIHGFAAPRRVHLVADVPDTLPVVFVDGIKVRQILYNLLSNAVKFSTAEGTVELAIHERDAEESPLEVESIEIVVVDHGSGIRPEDLQTIFQEFHQTAAVSKLGMGTGLGLAIARKFAVLQGGTIRAESVPGEGSTFRVWLPVDSRAFDTDFDSGPFRAIRADAATDERGA
jgi:signal transduction histidine kinase